MLSKRLTHNYSQMMASSMAMKNSIAKRDFAVELSTGSQKIEVSSDQSEPKIRPLYFDNQATTPLDPRVLDKMMPYLTENFGNPHSRSHSFGWESEQACEDARDQVGDLIGATGKEIIFTSGATESNNLCLKGIASFYGDKKKHIITTQIDHKCVLDSCRKLEDQGFDVTYLPVQTNGLIDLDEFRSAIRPDTLLTSIIHVNNEIGVVQPIKEIGQICRDNKVFFHTDAAQGVGKIPIDVDENNIDLLSISGHKLYGPKGIGALYVRRKPRVRLHGQMSGGGQEKGLRSGTLAPNLVVGLGEASRIAKEEMQHDTAHIQRLSKKFLEAMRNEVTHIVLNGDEQHRYEGNLNISFSCVEGESMIMGLKDLAVSSGSACTSASLEPSYVLRAIGVEEDMAHTSLRIGFGRFTTDEEVDYAIKLVGKEVNRLREMSVLWEMVQEGIDIKSI